MIVCEREQMLSTEQKPIQFQESELTLLSQLCVVVHISDHYDHTFSIHSAKLNLTDFFYHGVVATVLLSVTVVAVLSWHYGLF